MNEFFSTLGNLFLIWCVILGILVWSGVGPVVAFSSGLAIIPLAACITVTNQEERLREIGEGEQQ